MKSFFFNRLKSKFGKKGRVCRKNKRKLEIGYNTEKAGESLASTCPSSIVALKLPVNMTCNI